MKHLARILPIAMAFLLVIAGGIVHGVWTERWQTSRSLQQALARLPTVPLTVGDWQGKDMPVESQNYTKAGAHGWWMRRYEHKKHGHVVWVILMCGPSGPMSVHTPDVCYRGAGYKPSGANVSYTIKAKLNAPAAQFRTGNFLLGKSTETSGLRLFWSWSADGHWQAPKYPRLTFRGQRALFKLYTVRDIVSIAESMEDDPAVDLIRQLLPQLEKALFSEPSRDMPSAKH